MSTVGIRQKQIVDQHDYHIMNGVKLKIHMTMIDTWICILQLNSKYGQIPCYLKRFTMKSKDSFKSK